MFIRTRSNYTDNPSTRVLVTQHFWEIHAYVWRETVSSLIISILTYKIRMLANDLAWKVLEKKLPSKAIRFICLHVRSSLITKESDNYTTWVKINFALGGGGARIKTLKGKTEFQINSCSRVWHYKTCTDFERKLPLFPMVLSEIGSNMNE